MVLGHWLEMRTIAQARGALNSLAALLPDTLRRKHPVPARRLSPTAQPPSCST
jgi:Cu2+-exporting ATPase